MREYMFGIVTLLVAGQAVLAGESGLGLDLAGGVASEAALQPTDVQPGDVPPGDEPVPAADSDKAPAINSRPGFGRTGATFLTFGAGYMNDFENNHAADLNIGYSRFIADELEFNLELSGWYFVQDGNDTGGVSPFMNFRWHFWHDEAFDWSVYAEAGFGLLFAFDNVPEDGTGFNFMPRAGLGYTKQLDDEGTRLVLGARWQHISNGRIEGDERNPSRDSIMVYAGVMVPF